MKMKTTLFIEDITNEIEKISTKMIHYLVMSFIKK